MTKRAMGSNAQITEDKSKTISGFTIIETMLFLAIAGLMFAGLVAGTNGAIRQQRYKDSVQGFVDDLRDLYSLAENVQVIDYGDEKPYCGVMTGNNGRGRSSCSVYGVYAIISPSKGGRENVQAYWVTGKDQLAVKNRTSDLEFFQQAGISTETFFEDSSAVGRDLPAKSHSLLWGADLSLPCDIMTAANGCPGKGKSSNKNQVVIFVYRSPITGALNTFTRLYSDTNKEDHLENEDSFRDGKNLGFVIEDFEHKDVSFCISTGPGMSDEGGQRMVTIDGYGSNSNAVRLIEADSEDNKCN